MKRSTISTLLILLLIICIAGFFAWRAIQQANAPSDRPSAAQEAFLSASSSGAFTDYAGNRANLEQYEDAIIVAHAWASWVPTSPQSLRDLETLQAEYQDKNVVVLAINRGEPQKTARLFLERYEIDGVKLIADQGDRYFTAVEGKTMPETVFYDASGNVVFHKRGEMTLEEMRLRTNQAVRASQ